MKNKAIPVLTGKDAERFIKKSDDNLDKKGTVDFSKQSSNMVSILKKSNINYKLKNKYNMKNYNQCTDSPSDESICNGHPEICTCDYHCR